MNLITPEIMAEITDGNSTKLPDNTLKMLQILASLNTPKKLLASLLEIAEFSLHHVRYLAGPLVIHRSPWSDTIPQWLNPDFSQRLKKEESFAAKMTNTHEFQQFLA